MARPRAYFDTSVFIKRYVNEEGSSHVRNLMRTYQCLGSEIMLVEALSAFCRRRALGQITETACAKILSLLKVDRERWDLLAVDNSVLRRAEGVIRDSGLKRWTRSTLPARCCFRLVSDRQSHSSVPMSDS